MVNEYVYAIQLSEEGPREDISNDAQLASFNEWILSAKEFDSMWERISFFFMGPLGTGKTSLCNALAQKLSIRFSSRYPQCQLIEVNAHSLFSKWLSGSGKLVAKLLSNIQEMVEDESNLLFVLIDSD
ncbi:hypothetical protein CASFOL_030206 [Castilleja foliolosa]|uniref:Pachytene checkpoint protein 2 homolog n=1 Tax=Castilleja foliolosa TaxID=1961234 RepID=A0ABD3CD76_9LAMI